MEKDDLYQKHLKALRKDPPVIFEPTGEHGIHPAQFFEAVAGMGERALKNGTIARTVRNHD